eukprot:TRINITY_DN33803_c0_g1_i1.p1 TRINITY_DN33803_c0_g1~~TRINITY_DN33803_c0_g1_i1.p1  ORF type:complete len:446 (+),score=70.04 TRINITY_DN33803_c0_g1_i1:112-1449(+)
MTMYPTTNTVVTVEDAFTARATEIALCIFVALFVLRLEMQRRAAGAGAAVFAESGGAFAWVPGRTLLKHCQDCAPEVAGVVACLTLAALLRARGDTGLTAEASGLDEASQAAWEDIKEKWPILLTADTLLSLQAMLRLVVLLSSALRGSTTRRRGQATSFPVAGEGATLFLAAQLARAYLASRTTLYMLDGPLGGQLPVWCERIAIPLLAWLVGPSIFRRCGFRAVLACISAAVGVAWLSKRHYLSLSEEPFTDSLFISAHIFDFLFAASYLWRSLVFGSGDSAGARAEVAAVGFVHVIMTVQQSMSAYYFIKAFEPAAELVGRGLPFEILQSTNLVALGAYLSALIVYVAEKLDGSGAMAAERAQQDVRRRAAGPRRSSARLEAPRVQPRPVEATNVPETKMNALPPACAPRPVAQPDQSISSSHGRCSDQARLVTEGRSVMCL